MIAVGLVRAYLARGSYHGLYYSIEKPLKFFQTGAILEVREAQEAAWYWRGFSVTFENFLWRYFIQWIIYRQSLSVYWCFCHLIYKWTNKNEISYYSKTFPADGNVQSVRDSFRVRTWYVVEVCYLCSVRYVLCNIMGWYVWIDTHQHTRVFIVQSRAAQGVPVILSRRTVAQ